MLKLILSLVVLTFLVFFFQSQVSILLQGLGHFYQSGYDTLSMIFSGSQWGTLLRHMVVLFVIILAITGGSSVFYFLIYRKKFPYYQQLTWGFWLIVVTLILSK